MEFPADISSLSAMLDESRIALEGEANKHTQQPPQILAPSRVVMPGEKGIVKSSSSSKKGSKNDIWDTDEIPTSDSILSTNDDRKSPQYEFSYKQEVGTQDTFLGLNGKTPGSSDCSHLVSYIMLFYYVFECM
jgi:hypothetical protein